MRPTLTVIVDPADRWMTKAACVGQAPSYDESASQWEQRKAQAVCLTSCPVLEECREYSLEVRETHGIWGGLNEMERRALLRQRAAQAV